MSANALCIDVVLGLTAAAWIALALAAQDLFRHRARVPRLDVALAVSLFAAALAVRTLLPVPTLVHENHHGYRLDPYLPLAEDVTRSGITSGQLVLFKVVAYLLPRGGEPMFAMNVVFSSLAVAGMFVLARQIYTERAAAFAVASLLLLQPLAILMAPTEEFLVTASGLLLTGLPLVWLGARHDLPATLTAGVALVGLGASMREVTVPLAALAPLAMIAAAPEGARPAWRRVIAASLAFGALLAPFAIAALAARRAQGGAPDFVGLPRLPFALHGAVPTRDTRWVGWHTPYMPLWTAILGLVSFAALAVHAARRPEARRAALVPVLGLVIATAAGGVVSSTWFPSSMRHQLFAMAMLLLPCGFLFDRLARSRPGRLAAWIAPPVVAAATLAVAPEAARLDVPLTQEFVFLDQAVRSAPEQARAVILPRDASHPEHPPASFFLSRRPSWEATPLDALPRLVQRGSDRPVYLVLDRVCFLNVACIKDRDACRSPEVERAQESVATPYGRMLPECAEALTAAPFREIARRTIVRRGDRSTDLPSLEPTATLAVLVWDGNPR